MTTFIAQPMAWTNERINFSSNDCINLKTLWKMLIFDDTESVDIKSENVSRDYFFVLFFIFKFNSTINEFIHNHQILLTCHWTVHLSSLSTTRTVMCKWRQRTWREKNIAVNLEYVCVCVLYFIWITSKWSWTLNKIRYASRDKRKFYLLLPYF